MWKKKEVLSSCVLALGKGNVCVLIPARVYLLCCLLIRLGVNVPLYVGTKSLFACAYWCCGRRGVKGAADCVGVCAAFSMWLPLCSAKQVVVCAFFICIWRPLSLCRCGHSVIVGRDSNHVAVCNHYTAIEKDNVLHIWSFPPLTQDVNISTGVRLPEGFGAIWVHLFGDWFAAACSVPFRNFQSRMILLA